MKILVKMDIENTSLFEKSLLFLGFEMEPMPEHDDFMYYSYNTDI